MPLASAQISRVIAATSSLQGQNGIAKNGYVRGNVGWFSNRSATYLAAGRPVVVQDTGFAPVLPVGEDPISESGGSRRGDSGCRG